MSDLKFHSALVCCGNFQRPGLALDFTPYVDFSNKKTTEDQVRIEAVLEDVFEPESRYLHVGVGNSILAQKFCAKGVVIDGVTVSDAEKNYASSLNIANYSVYKANKYHRNFMDYFDKIQFDFIIDNNLASFACCQYHFYQMLDNYIACLKPGAKILTDQRGMDWALLDPCLIMDFDDLRNVLRHLPVRVSKVTDMVFAIELLALDHVPEHEKLSVYARRYQDGQTYIESFNPDTAESDDGY